MQGTMEKAAIKRDFTSYAAVWCQWLEYASLQS